MFFHETKESCRKKRHSAPPKPEISYNLIILLRLERLLRLENLSQPDADKYCAGDNHFKHGHIYAQK